MACGLFGIAFLFSPLGTAGVSANIKYANNKKVPHLFVLSGANKFTNHVEYPYTTTGLASYDTEGKVYAKFISEKMPGSRIAITGGAGYIGSLLTGELLRRGHQVKVLATLLFGGES